MHNLTYVELKYIISRGSLMDKAAASWGAVPYLPTSWRNYHY